MASLVVLVSLLLRISKPPVQVNISLPLNQESSIQAPVVRRYDHAR
eukprot:CAMPEP_0185780316 /NCGR_PEP_ID=MMETSP1174-20130828/98709_1 /TAXON_ID=35687 /ORGANISM="Dictyocha speculum, Strain CCMP1381" /LENGTH=45 /DNA_ID= /DNA_START= /DNA_END= /DNA_ORIENTATION=